MILPGNSIVQIAFVVDTLETAIAHFTKTMGLGAFTLVPHVELTGPTYRGTPQRTDFSIAVTQAGDVQLELIEQHDDTPSIYRDLYPRGKHGFHHVAVVVPDVAAEARRYTDMGFAIGSSGRFGTSDFVYVDTTPVLGHMVEILPDDAGVGAFFAAVRTASAA